MRQAICFAQRSWANPMSSKSCWLTHSVKSMNLNFLFVCISTLPVGPRAHGYCSNLPCPGRALAELSDRGHTSCVAAPDWSPGAQLVCYFISSVSVFFFRLKHLCRPHVKTKSINVIRRLGVLEPDILSCMSDKILLWLKDPHSGVVGSALSLLKTLVRVRAQCTIDE